MDPTSLVPPNPVSTWQEYFDATKPMPLHYLFQELEPFLPNPGLAADLGCGVGHAVLFLAEKGWTVEAYDGHAEALAALRSRLAPEHRVTTHHALLQNVELAEGKYDLVIAAYSLFFLPPGDFQAVWRRIRSGLKPGGLFVGEFLGKNDDWADRFTTQSREEAEELLDGLDTLYFEEAERDGFVSQGQPKHWHIYHVIARAPSAV